MRSLVVVLVSLLTTEVAATVRGKLYSSAGLNDKSFTDNLVFTSPTRSVVHCALLCHQRKSCVTFTFEHAVCRGHSNKVTTSTPANYNEGARSYVKENAEVPRKTECDSSDSGVVTIYPADDTSLQVYCDNDTDGGGWLVCQRRKDGRTNFTRNWTDYKQGFGDLQMDFWLGLDALHMLTSRHNYDLRVDLMKFDGSRGYATYSNFSIGDSNGYYRLQYNMFKGGDAGNCLSYNSGKQFSTWDADHDFNPNNCALDKKGGWWYGSCTFCNLNALLKDSRQYGEDGVFCSSFDGFYSLKFAEMKIRQA